MSNAKPFAVQRQCTCPPRRLFSECGANAFHEVDQHDDEQDARADVDYLNRTIGRHIVAYRLVRRSDGAVLAS